MTLHTLTRKLLTTFFSIAFGILLIPDLWMPLFMDLLDVCSCCNISLMDLRGRRITWFLTPFRWACLIAVSFGPLKPMWNAHTSCPPKFLHQTCHANGRFISIFFETTSEHGWWNAYACKRHCVIFVHSPTVDGWNRSQPIPFGITRSTNCQKIWSTIQKNVLNQSRKRNPFQERESNKNRESHRCIVSMASVI